MLATVALSIVVTYLICLVVEKTVGFRLSKDLEMEGLDGAVATAFVGTFILALHPGQSIADPMYESSHTIAILHFGQEKFISLII